MSVWMLFTCFKNHPSDLLDTGRGCWHVTCQNEERRQRGSWAIPLTWARGEADVNKLEISAAQKLSEAACFLHDDLCAFSPSGGLIHIKLQSLTLFCFFYMRSFKFHAWQIVWGNRRDLDKMTLVWVSLVWDIVVWALCSRANTRTEASLQKQRPQYFGHNAPSRDSSEDGSLRF